MLAAIRMNRSRIDRCVLVAAFVSVALSLLLRVWHRGGNLPGWDYLLTTEGQFLLETRGWWGALRETVVQTRHFWLRPRTACRTASCRPR